VLRTRGTRIAVSVVAVAATAAIAVPTTAGAEPTPPPAPAVQEIIPGISGIPAGLPAVPKGIPVDALASLAPAILGAVAGPADEIAEPGSPQSALIDQARQILETAGLPPEIKSALESVIKFLDGSGGGGPALPPKDGPIIAQFLYPSIGKGCISSSADSIGTALAVPGPAHLPPPGPAAHQTGFVFTALGTKVPTVDQKNPLTVSWLNLDNGRQGTQNLTDAAKINHPDGPATLSTIADTGSGRVLAVISGSLTTGDDARECSFLPTVGMVTVA